MLDVIFSKSFKETESERKVNTLIDLLSDTGGFAGLVTIVVGYFIGSS
jgi:hypothetical protein